MLTDRNEESEHPQTDGLVENFNKTLRAMLAKHSRTLGCNWDVHLQQLLFVVSPASLLDSQHGCIASPHAKKESGQTPQVVWSCTVSKCGRTVSKDE